MVVKKNYRGEGYGKAILQYVLSIAKEKGFYATGKVDFDVLDAVDEFLAAAERMRLGDYIRFESDRKRRLLDAFFQGIMRGLGAMVGFAVLGAVLVWLLQKIAENNLPGISDFVARIVKLVQLRIN